MSDNIERGNLIHGQQPMASEEEKLQRANQMKTQGRRGCKMDRRYISFTPANSDFVRIVSRIQGKPMSTFINEIVDDYRVNHPELYEKAKALIEEYGGDE